MLSSVTTYTPQTLVEGYVDAIDSELDSIARELVRIHDEAIVLEDRAHALRRLRERHVDALRALTPPSTLTDLVAGPEVDATT